MTIKRSSSRATSKAASAPSSPCMTHILARWPYASESEAVWDVLRLSRGMSYKAAWDASQKVELEAPAEIVVDAFGGSGAGRRQVGRDRRSENRENP